jgi:CDP-glucose 4,6-dehydratase
VEGVVKEDVFGAFAGKRVLVTGDTGFKGSWLALWLSELGADVTGLALPADPANILAAAVADAKLIRHIEGDIRDLDTVRRAVATANPDFVFHLAAQALLRRSYAEPQATFATNLLGSVNLLEAVRQTDGVRALVYITSDKCYLNKERHEPYREDDELGGRDPYSASKACAELAFRAYIDSFLAQRPGPGAASTRAGNVIGGGDRSADRIVPDTIAALEASRPVVLRNPRATRPWQHVLDPLYGYLRLAVGLTREPKRLTGAYNFGPEEGAIRTVDDLARAVVRAWGTGEVIHRPDANAPHEATLLHLSSAKARRLLGWRAQWDFDRAAAESARWYRAVHDGAAPLAVSRAQILAYSKELVAA